MKKTLILALIIISILSITSLAAPSLPCWVETAGETAGLDNTDVSAELMGKYSDMTYEVVDGKVTITDCEPWVTSVTIPRFINYCPVTRIGEHAFSDCESLESIYITDNVTSIGDYAFCHCTSLERVMITGRDVTFGYEVFNSCDNCFINGYRTSTSKSYANSYRIPFVALDEVGHGEIIAAGACGYYVSWAVYEDGTLIIEGDEEISYGSWENYKDSIIDVKIIEGVTSIGSQAFSGCSSLTSITIPDSVTSIGNHAFLGCSSLTSIEIGNSVTSIGDWAFVNCSNLTSITIPDSVTSIGDYAFYYCTSLTSITIPDSVTSIGECAFSYCTSLEKATILSRDVVFGDYVFRYCSNLTIYGYKNSTSESYANEYSIPFIALEDICEHSYGDWIVEREPTVDSDGVEYRICENCGDRETRDIPKLTASLKITVDKCEAFVGKTVTVNINLSENPGFSGMAFDIIYDSDVLEAISVDNGLLGDACVYSYLTKYDGKINFQYAVIENKYQNDVLVSVTFKVKEDAPEGFTAIDFIPHDGTFFRYSGRTEQDITVYVENGGVTVKNYLPGDINGDGIVSNRDAARLMQYLAGWDVEFIEDALDVTGDGVVNNRDAARILQYLAGWDVELH